MSFPRPWKPKTLRIYASIQYHKSIELITKNYYFIFASEIFDYDLRHNLKDDDEEKHTKQLI